MIDIDRLCPYCMKENDSIQNTCSYCMKSRTQFKKKESCLDLWTILNGRYLLGDVLGQGGFGITYIGYDLKNDRRVAIKELFIASKMKRVGTRPELREQNDLEENFYRECKNKFLREAEILYKLEDKTGVVTILDFFEENDTAYIVMEYLDGIDLKEYPKSQGGKLSCEKAFELLRPVMKCLIRLHEMGIIHRDISPDNIRYLKTNEMKLMDLGSAKQLAESQLSVLVTLKKGYAPREQYLRNYSVGPWIDVYAISATYFWCVTGQTPPEAPFRKSDDDLKPKLDEIGMPLKLQRVLLKGLALRVDDRYQDMWSFYQDMKSVMMPNPEPDPDPSSLWDRLLHWIRNMLSME